MVAKEVELVELPDGRHMPVTEYNERLALLSKPFAQDEIEKLPKQVRKNDEERGKCEQGSRYSADGFYCGGWHARSMHLDYVGHAGITDRLNAVDPLWHWEPFALSPAGTPLLTDGGMWARMTVLGVTRIGFGDPGRNSGPNAIKETIGDFIRNAAMRFGVGTYLWSKSEAAAAKKIAEEDHDVEPPQQRAQQQPPQQQPPSVDWQQSLIDAQGDADRLAALRAMAGRAGAPPHYMAAVDAAIQECTPIEGTVTNA
ncbi:hypothetical protein ACX800_09875 [Paenarthrobacter nitroguajacolicus]|uniref:hypothetical protein n=1 Tax=Paenarthrobacter nitroguajacolicus TaxID=211146 RepID=UPI003D1CEAF4